jgi:hypothetical protein
MLTQECSSIVRFFLIRIFPLLWESRGSCNLEGHYRGNEYIENYEIMTHETSHLCEIRNICLIHEFFIDFHYNNRFNI